MVCLGERRNNCYHGYVMTDIIIFAVLNWTQTGDLVPNTNMSIIKSQVIENGKTIDCDYERYHNNSKVKGKYSYILFLNMC